MNKKTVLLAAQSIFVVVTAIMLIVSDLSIYFKGLEARAADPMADIYTLEAITSKLVTIFPVFLCSVAVTILNVIYGIRDENADKAAMAIDIRKNEAGSDKSGKTGLKICILALAVAFIVIGIFNGSMLDVFIKASKICTECIGLG